MSDFLDNLKILDGFGKYENFGFFFENLVILIFFKSQNVLFFENVKIFNFIDNYDLVCKSSNFIFYEHFCVFRIHQFSNSA